MVSVINAAIFTRTSADTRLGAIEHPQIPYPRILMDRVASPLRGTQTRLRPLQRKIPTKAKSLHGAHLLPWGIEDVGPMLHALDGTTLARMSLSTAKAVRQEHRMPFTRSLRHALRIFCKARNALQVAPADGPHSEALVTNLERTTKLLHITPALLQSSDRRCNQPGRYDEYTRGEVTGLIDWLVVFAGRSRQKAQEDTPKLAEYERVS